MPVCCVVYGCSNRSGREKNKRFYRVPKVVVHKAEKCKKLTEERRKKWLSNYICGREEQSRLMHVSAATTSSEGALALWVTLSR
ncbi:hypothetical protein CgunFtcFv8_015810 [Champsocephalus gunnari]|uniref:THAP-type domain-containing protein n=1 Tax=Champsocephalus gunnari TaxID=52237 RepID=A0AAN8H3N3_CHAGU|nr:hypothetical protein CgunFtcFv8_015810 [Champsocephalus gunnari]